MGMTLIELLIALTVFGVVITISVAFITHENAAFQSAVTRLVALRNARYAISTLDENLETLGTDVPTEQPSFLYGDTDAIAFSANYATNIADDPFAVFYDPKAPNGQVSAPAGPIAIPTTSDETPDTTYEAAPGVRSPAEIILFYFEPDTSTARTDDYILYRQVNDGTPEAVARNLLRDGSKPFFSYERFAVDSEGQDVLALVPDSLIPIIHTAKIHLSPADTGRSALADSIRAVLVSLQATNGLTGAAERRVTLSRLIPLPNAVLGKMATCGSPPILGVSLTARADTLSDGAPAVTLTWNPAVDEVGGEKDVVRYVIWRRDNGATSWGDPYVAVPAGKSSYSYQDGAVIPGTTYQYGLAAQDCTPSLSTIAASSPVTIP